MILELIIAHPKLSIVFIGFLITLGITLITKFFTDQKRLKELKGKQKENQIKMKEVTDISMKNKIMHENLGHSMEMMKHSIKPMLIYAIPILLLISWLSRIFSETTISSTWIWWYIGSAIFSSIILRKVLDVA